MVAAAAAAAGIQVKAVGEHTAEDPAAEHGEYPHVSAREPAGDRVRDYQAGLQAC